MWAGRREGEDLLAECVSVGTCLYLSCDQWSDFFSGCSSCSCLACYEFSSAAPVSC